MEFNHDTIKKLRGLILFTVIAVLAGVNYRGIILLAGAFIHMMSPFILGAAIAFILNVPMRSVEKRLPGLKKYSRLKRPVSMILSLLFVAGILFLVTFVVAPQLVRTVFSLQSRIPEFLAAVKVQAEQIFSDNPEILEYLNQIEVDWPKVLNDLAEFLKNGASSMLNTTFSAALSIANGLSTFLIGFIFSIYILLQKETLGRQFKMLLRAFLPDKTVSVIVSIAALTERTFSNFLTGQCMEAVILGTMFFIVLTLFRLPYSLLIGVLIAFTALIPIFGAFIGLGVGVFLMLMISPMDALLFIVLFLVLQQIEGNLIYPHVVGNSVGLPSIWVLAAVTIGGSMMGIVGMLIFIPLCSVLYALLRGIVHVKLKEKKRKIEKTEEKNRNNLA